MANTFSIGEKQFKVGKIHAFKQFHIVRRIAPILGELMPIMAKLGKEMKNPDGLSQDEQFEKLAVIAGPVMIGFSKLSDDDSNKVLLGLLSAVEMKMETGNYAKLSNGDTLMFDNLELPLLLQAAGRSFMFNMSGFFNVLPQVS